jgi:hypothetical protein
MKKWLLQTSTIGGLILLTITGIQAYQSSGDALTAVLAVLTLALLLVKDGKFLAGLVVMLFVVHMSAACASIPMSKPAQVKTAVSIGCAVLSASGCFDDVQDAFPGLNAVTCSSVINSAVDVALEVQHNFKTYPREEASIKSLGSLMELSEIVKNENWDPLKVKPESLNPKSSCRQAARALGVK